MWGQPPRLSTGEARRQELLCDPLCPLCLILSQPKSRRAGRITRALLHAEGINCLLVEGAEEVFIFLCVVCPFLSAKLA